ncbi:hypothetical protein NPIL_579151 [Nephila pilipes]|uniref:Uncharacterized protein n=1 Tax=Nephila pilipes TaxID=299642 RepID=A0A8X6I8V1_NEPPI|nr:hypothetical protein NPIL_579151 [Nephila pilipes]
MRASLGEQPLQSCIETFHFRGKGEGRGSQRIVEGQNEHYRVNSRIRGQSKDNVHFVLPLSFGNPFLPPSLESEMSQYTIEEAVRLMMLSSSSPDPCVGNYKNERDALLDGDIKVLTMY